VIAAGAMESLEQPFAVLGLLLVVGAIVSGVAKRSFLSLTALFVLAGFALGEGGLGVLDFDPRGGFVEALAVIALLVILFRDGLEVEAEMLQTAWHLPLRKLVLAMPITAALVACTAKALTDLSWTEAFLLGALISPTDPVLSSSVVTNPRVPRVIRHSLNLESGLNDGLALPAVLALVAALAAEEDFVWWQFVLQDVSLGLATGALVGAVGSRLLPSSSALGHEITAHQKALYALGIAFVAYAAAVLQPEGNGFISVFVCAIVLGILRPDVRGCFEARSEELIEIVKLAIFVVFGSLLTFGGLFADGVAAVAIAAFVFLVARPVAVFVALVGTRGVDRPTKAFMAWFGPRGVATMTFALLVLGAGLEESERLFNLAALVVFCSILAHGLTDNAGSEWIARHAERREAARRGEPDTARAAPARGGG
jgi:NhaP-type Na+/H+ or K+/H+ antiporter